MLFGEEIVLRKILLDVRGTTETMELMFGISNFVFAKKIYATKRWEMFQQVQRPKQRHQKVSEILELRLKFHDKKS